MANIHKGEIGFTVDGKDYVAHFSTNALCELEDKLNVGINVISDQLSKPENLRLGTVRAVLWAALRDNHKDLSIAQVGELVDKLKLQGAVELIGKALTAAFPLPEGAENPPKPGTESPAGTGMPSSANGASAVSPMRDFGGQPQRLS